VALASVPSLVKPTGKQPSINLYIKSLQIIIFTVLNVKLKVLRVLQPKISIEARVAKPPRKSKAQTKRKTICRSRNEKDKSSQ
jgi:hypothetical protein